MAKEFQADSTLKPVFLYFSRANPGIAIPCKLPQFGMKCPVLIRHRINFDV